jgi:hypothetical protein
LSKFQQIANRLSGKGISQYFPVAWEHNVIDTGEERGVAYEVHGVRVTGVVGVGVATVLYMQLKALRT